MLKLLNKMPNKWIIWFGIFLGLIILVLIVFWYQWRNNKAINTNYDYFADTTNPADIVKPFVWRLEKTGENNSVATRLIDKNNNKHIIKFCVDDLVNRTATKTIDIPDANIISESEPIFNLNKSELDFNGQIIGLNITGNTTEYLQVLYNKISKAQLGNNYYSDIGDAVNPDETNDYYFLRRDEMKQSDSGFTICMWVKFPGKRQIKSNTNATLSGQSEYLVEIMKVGAEKSNTNTGGYFFILRRDTGSLEAGFLGPGNVVKAKQNFNDLIGWNHIAVSCKRNELKLFINGENGIDNYKDDTKNITGTTNNDATIFVGPDVVFNIGKNSRGLTPTCNACGYARFYMVDLQLHSKLLSADEIKKICKYSDINTKINFPFNWMVSETALGKLAFIDTNNTPYNFNINGITNPISDTKDNTQLTFYKKDDIDLVNISNNYLRFLPQSNFPDAYKLYTFMATAFTLEIKCKFAEKDSFGNARIYTPYDGESEYIMEFMAKGAERGETGKGGYLFIVRRPRDRDGNIVEDTNHISIGVLGKEIRSNDPITDFSKIYTITIIFEKKNKNNNILSFYLDGKKQTQHVEYITNETGTPEPLYKEKDLTLLDTELPQINSDTQFNIGYGTRLTNTDKTSRLSIQSVKLSDSVSIPTTTTTAETTTTKAGTTTTTKAGTTITTKAATTKAATTKAAAATTKAATTTTNAAEGAKNGVAINGAMNGVAKRAATNGTGETENGTEAVNDNIPMFAWSISIKNGKNIMGAGNNIMNNQIVALTDVEPSNTPQPINLDVYNGNIVGLNMRQNTTNKEYLQFLPNPTFLPSGSDIIGFKEYDFLTPTENGKGFTISMTVKFKIQTNQKSETLLELFDPSTPNKYFYIKRLQNSGTDVNKIICGYDNQYDNQYAKSNKPITDNLWNNIVVSVVSKSENKKTITVYTNGEKGSSKDLDMENTQIKLTDKAIINIGKNSKGSTDMIYSAILLADLQFIGRVLNDTEIKDLATTSINNLPMEIERPQIQNLSMFSFATVPVQLS